MKKKRIVIDLVPIRVGEGGTGSGIWTYARELLLAMDELDFQGLEIHCLANDGQLEYLPMKRIQIHAFPAGGKNILKRLGWVHVQLPLWCLSRKVDVLHKVATETPWICSAKRITTIHDFYYEFLMEHHPSESIRLYERLENVYFSLVTKLCFKKSQALIAVSEATRNEAIRRYPASANRTHVVHHGSPVGRDRPPGEPHRPARRSDPPDSKLPTSNAHLFNILCVAKFMEHKGQHLLIRAFEQLLQTHPNLKGQVRLSLRGFHNDQDYFRRIKLQVDESRYAASVHFIPFNPAEQVDRIYADADLVVLLSDYEGFGLPVLEAQSFGIPVLCSDLDVLKETGGQGAGYVHRENTEQVAEALAQFIQDGEYRNTMTCAALENTERFSWKKAAQETLNIYQSI